MTRMALICILALILGGCSTYVVEVTEVEEITPNDISVRLHLEDFPVNVRCFNWNTGERFIDKETQVFFKTGEFYTDQVTVGENRYTIRSPAMKGAGYPNMHEGDTAWYLEELLWLFQVQNASCDVRTTEPFLIEIWDGEYHETFSYELEAYQDELWERRYDCINYECTLVKGVTERAYIKSLINRLTKVATGEDA